MKPNSITVVLLLALGLAFMNGCTTTAATGELELSAAGSTQDHRKIATYYRHEAAKLRQASEDLSVRITVYERLFGPASDWVAGTRLLAQSYKGAAQEYERKAQEHVERIHESPRATGEGLESR